MPLPMPLNPLGASSGATNPYVANGLIAMWDGFWNTGVIGSEQDMAATSWVDVVGGITLQLNAKSSWQTGVLSRASGGTGSAAWTTSDGINPALVRTLEAVHPRHNNGRCLVLINPATGVTSSVAARCIMSASGCMCALANTNPRAISGGITNKHFSICYTSSGAVSSAVCGSQSQTLSNVSGWLNDPSYAGIHIGSRRESDSETGGNGYPIVGSFGCIRLYSRELTAAEIAANYAVDRRRFGV